MVASRSSLRCTPTVKRVELPGGKLPDCATIGSSEDVPRRHFTFLARLGRYPLWANYSHQRISSSFWLSRFCFSDLASCRSWVRDLAKVFADLRKLSRGRRRRLSRKLLRRSPRSLRIRSNRLRNRHLPPAAFPESYNEMTATAAKANTNPAVFLRVTRSLSSHTASTIVPAGYSEDNTAATSRRPARVASI